MKKCVRTDSKTCTWKTNGWGIIMYLSNHTELDMMEKVNLCNITVTAL